MSIEVYALTTDPGETGKIKLDEKEILSTLGAAEESLALKLKDLFKSVIQSISEDVKTEAKLEIEVSGSINLKAEGGIKYLFFNIGGETSRSGSMKINLTTTINAK